MFQVRSDGLGLLLFAKEGMAGTLGATRFYACARHGARARHTRTHAAGRGRRLGIRSHRLRLRLLGFLPGRKSRAARAEAARARPELRGVGRRRADRAGGPPRPGAASRSSSPRLSNPRVPSLLPPAARVHSSRDAAGLGADRVGVGTVAQLVASLGGAPPGHPLKDAIVAAERIGPPGALFIYLFFLSPFSRAEPFCEQRLVPRAGPACHPG